MSYLLKKGPHFKPEPLSMQEQKVIEPERNIHNQENVTNNIQTRQLEKEYKIL